ncbi:unnamed protein product [Linum trigynum]|uniref:Uncharacterized protein n=1 Tax=Linum trigynum TaxID=586398 RepID=A0AAV2FJY4_9ROSI
MAASHFTFILLLPFLSSLSSATTFITLDLIHRDSPLSTLYNPNHTAFDRLHAAFLRSISCRNHRLCRYTPRTTTTTNRGGGGRRGEAAGRGSRRGVAEEFDSDDRAARVGPVDLGVPVFRRRLLHRECAGGTRNDGRGGSGGGGGRRGSGGGRGGRRLDMVDGSREDLGIRKCKEKKKI